MSRFNDLYVPHSDSNSRFRKPNEPSSQILHDTGSKPVAPPQIFEAPAPPDVVEAPIVEGPVSKQELPIVPIVPVEKIDSPYQQVYTRERNVAPDDLYVPHSDTNSKFRKPNEPSS